MLFSQRNGLKPIKLNLQKDSIDSDLKVGVWNALNQNYFERVNYNNIFIHDPKIWQFFRTLWMDYFKEPINTMSDDWRQYFRYIGNYYTKSEWYEVYDFVEFIVQNYPGQRFTIDFTKEFNGVSEREMSAYRIVGENVVEITSPYELAAIEQAIADTSPLKSVNIHLKTALELISDRTSPDYRNSIKESISAVEAISIMITQNPKATLGQALKTIEERIGIHAALKSSFSSLYGYTSDADGIRHSLFEDSTLNFEDAKYFLVTCSAFINYLIAKCQRNDISLH